MEFKWFRDGIKTSKKKYVKVIGFIKKIKEEKIEYTNYKLFASFVSSSLVICFFVNVVVGSYQLPPKNKNKIIV